MWADDIVPRDTDPVSRSGLGYLKSGFAKHALILIPLVNDSSRKLAYMLKTMGLKVHTFVQASEGILNSFFNRRSRIGNLFTG